MRSWCVVGVLVAGSAPVSVSLAIIRISRPMSFSRSRQYPQLVNCIANVIECHHNLPFIPLPFSADMSLQRALYSRPKYPTPEVPPPVEESPKKKKKAGKKGPRTPLFLSLFVHTYHLLDSISLLFSPIIVSVVCCNSFPRSYSWAPQPLCLSPPPRFLPLSYIPATSHSCLSSI